MILEQNDMARIWFKSGIPSFLCNREFSLLASMRDAEGGLIPQFTAGDSFASIAPGSEAELLLAKEMLCKGAPYFSTKFEFLRQNTTLGMFPYFQDDQLALILCCIFTDNETCLNNMITVPLAAVSDLYRAPAMDIFNLLSVQAGRLNESEDYQTLSYLNETVRRCQDVLRISSATRDYSLLQLGRMEFAPTPHLLSSFLQELCVVVQLLLADTQRSLYFEPCSSAIVASFDENLLMKAVLQLLANAFRYSPADSAVRLGLSLQGKSAAITIWDEGIGIPQDQLSRVFDPFFLLPDSVPPGEDPGLGLGLTIAQQIARLHQGQIYLSSRENAGTQVALSLPISDLPPDSLTLRSGGTKYVTDRFSDLHLTFSRIFHLDLF